MSERQPQRSKRKSAPASLVSLIKRSIVKSQSKSRRDSKVGGSRAPPANATAKVYRSTKPKGTVYTEEIIQEKLSTYRELPRSQWDNLKWPMHVRYYDKTGFKPGGFVKAVSQNHDGKYVIMANSPKTGTPGYKSWPVMFKNISKLYVKNKK
jgi:hypothetical protein